jgi:hypothetical protein
MTIKLLFLAPSSPGFRVPRSKLNQVCFFLDSRVPHASFHHDETRVSDVSERLCFDRADGDGSHEECGHVDVVFIFISKAISKSTASGRC